jgi:hypothetical protein
MGKALELIGDANHQQPGLGVMLQKTPASGQGNSGSMVATHAIYSQRDHGDRNGVSQNAKTSKQRPDATAM